MVKILNKRHLRQSELIKSFNQESKKINQIQTNYSIGSKFCRIVE